MGNEDFWTRIHSWYHKAWWEEKRKAFQGNLLNYLTSRLTKRHGQTVHLQQPVVITVYKRKFSFFIEAKISFSENGRWSLFIHPSQRVLFFLAPFAFLLHKYTHMFVCEMGNPLLCELLAVCFCFLISQCCACSIGLHCQLVRSGEAIKGSEKETFDRDKLKSAGITWVSGGLLSSLGVLPTSKINPFLLWVAKGDSRVRPSVEHQWNDAAKLSQSFH